MLCVSMRAALIQTTENSTSPEQRHPRIFKASPSPPPTTTTGSIRSSRTWYLTSQDDFLRHGSHLQKKQKNIRKRQESPMNPRKSLRRFQESSPPLAPSPKNSKKFNRMWKHPNHQFLLAIETIDHHWSCRGDVTSIIIMALIMIP